MVSSLELKIELRERINKPARTPEDLNIHELLDDLLQEG